MVHMARVTSGMPTQVVFNPTALRKHFIHPTTPYHGGKALKVHSATPLNRKNTMSARTVSAVASSEATSTQNVELVASLIEFLKEDLQHLFDDQGIDQSKYEQNVVFEDPITKHSSLNGYLLNIEFLRRIFDPSFNLVDIRQTGPLEITTRWAMVMRPTFVRLPALQNFWNPVLTFTGTSKMGVNPATGKFNSHSDTWDAVSNQEFFSIEAFIHMLGQVFDLRRVPQGLESPPYLVLLKRGQYEVRQYEPFVVAEAPCGSTGSAAFGSLAGYIFGKNAAGQRMAMTTPVLSTSDKMQFYLGNKAEVAKLPQPIDPGVDLREFPGGLFAVATFNGVANDAEEAKTAAELRRAAEADGVPLVVGGKKVLARYNDPGTPPPFRRNEVLLPVDESKFKLW